MYFELVHLHGDAREGIDQIIEGMMADQIQAFIAKLQSNSERYIQGQICWGSRQERDAFVGHERNNDRRTAVH